MKVIRFLYSLMLHFFRLGNRVFGVGCMISWIDENLAVTDATIGLMDVRESLPADDYLITDVRIHFKQVYEDSIEHTMPRSIRTFWRYIGLLSIVTNATKVILHCQGGIDRAPFVAACVLVAKEGIRIEEAYRIVKEKRPQTFIHPEWIEWVRKTYHGDDALLCDS